MSVAATWGADQEERSLSFPCDRRLERSDAAYYRGVTIDAPPGIVFRWLCQMRVAPYSYDWLDNFGRRSPRTLTPGLDELAVGLTTKPGPLQLLRSFEIVDFERDRRLTMLMRSWLWGQTALTYLIVPGNEGFCR